MKTQQRVKTLIYRIVRIFYPHERINEDRIRKRLELQVKQRQVKGFFFSIRNYSYIKLVIA